MHLTASALYLLCVGKVMSGSLNISIDWSSCLLILKSSLSEQKHIILSKSKLVLF